MVYAIILLCICQITAPLVAYKLITRYIEAKQLAITEQIQKTIASWVNSPEEGKPSQLANVLGACGSVVGSAAAQSILASFNQQASSTAEVANGLANKIAIQQNPLMGLFMGKKGKGAAIQRLAEILGPMLMQHSGNNGNDTIAVVRKHHE